MGKEKLDFNLLRRRQEHGTPISDGNFSPLVEMGWIFLLYLHVYKTCASPRALGIRPTKWLFEQRKVSRTFRSLLG